MHIFSRFSIRSASTVLYLIGAIMLLAACQPIVDTRITETGVAPAAIEAPDVTAETTPDASPATTTVTDEEALLPGLAPASATVGTRSLRVREAPSDDAEVTAGIREGERFTVTAITTDGGWLQIEVPAAPEGIGWVASTFMILEGDITNIPTIDVETGAVVGTAVTIEAATTTPEADAEEPVAEEPVAEETEAEEPVASETTPEATPEPQEEPATTEAPVAEATPEATAAEETEAEEMAAEESEPSEPTIVATPALTITTSSSVPEGYVRINTRTPLRVRSEPTTEADNRVGHVFINEEYEVIEFSTDGLWVHIITPQPELPDDGWVAAEFVIVGTGQ